MQRHNAWRHTTTTEALSKTTYYTTKAPLRKGLNSFSTHQLDISLLMSTVLPICPQIEYSMAPSVCSSSGILVEVLPIPMWSAPHVGIGVTENDNAMGTIQQNRDWVALLDDLQYIYLN